MSDLPAKRDTQSVDEFLSRVGGKSVIGLEAGQRPIITSRVTYVDDMAEGRWVECEIEMRSGAKAFGRINPKQLARDAPPEFWDRVSLVHATLLFWGVGDVSWHRRDVGRCACMLLAMTLPQDLEPFAAAIASPEALAGYLTSGA